MLKKCLITLNSKAIRSCDLMVNKRSIQVSTVNFYKYKRNRFNRPEITQEYDESHLKSDHRYFERNDNLLDLDVVFRQIDRQSNNQQKFRSKEGNGQSNQIWQKNKNGTKFAIKSEFSKKIKLNSKDVIDESNMSDIEKRFIDDLSVKDIYGSTNQVVLDGINLINDVIYNNYPKILRIYYSDDKKLSKINDIDELREDGVEFLKVDFDLIRKYSEVIDPQGVIAIAEINASKLYELNMKRNQNEVPLILILNKVKDPGNMGTIVRTSLACGINKLLCLDGCAKLLRGKVIRSTAGAIFQMPFIEKISASDLENHIQKNARIYLSDSRGVNFDENLIKLTEDAVNDLPNEENKVDAKNDLDNEGEKLKTENNLQMDSDEHGDLQRANDEGNQYEAVINKPVDLQEMIHKFQQIEAFNYTDIDYFENAKGCIVLIANGETGLSPEIIDFVKGKKCVKVHIPLANSVDSLNTATAASIIMFEIKRQYLTKFSK